MNGKNHSGTDLWNLSRRRTRECDLGGILAGRGVFLACPGPSLVDMPLEMLGEEATVVALNTAYPLVRRPWMWIGMDGPWCYDARLGYESFFKVWRGGFERAVEQGHALRDLPGNLFAGVRDGEPETLADPAQPHLFGRNSLVVALSVLARLGAGRIYLLGCDFGGRRDYWDPARVLTDAQRERNHRLYGQTLKTLPAMRDALAQQGTTLVSCTPASPANKVLPHEHVTLALRREEPDVVARPVRYCTDWPGTAACSGKTAGREAGAKRRRGQDEVAVVVPTRGDRGVFLEQCLKMIAWQTKKAGHTIVVNRPPQGEGNDQRERVKEGVEIAARDGYERVVIMEDDDYYPPDYLERLLKEWDEGVPILGQRKIQAYHLLTRDRVEMDVLSLADKACALAGTAFTVGFWMAFEHSGMMGTKRNLDNEMWAFAYQSGARYKMIEGGGGMISMKHGRGKCAGGCHDPEAFRKLPWVSKDMGGEWLREHTDARIHDFYMRGWLQMGAASAASAVE